MQRAKKISLALIKNKLTQKHGVTLGTRREKGVTRPFPFTESIKNGTILSVNMTEMKLNHFVNCLGQNVDTIKELFMKDGT